MVAIYISPAYIFIQADCLLRYKIGYIFKNGGAGTTVGTEKLRIASDGEVTEPLQPSFQAYHVNGTNGSNITFNNTYHNIGNHFNASTGVFTCPVNGRYLFTFAFLHSNSPTTYARVLFRINGSTNTRYGDTLCDDTGLYINTSMSMIFNLSENKYIINI